MPIQKSLALSEVTAPKEQLALGPVAVDGAAVPPPEALWPVQTKPEVPAALSNGPKVPVGSSAPLMAITSQIATDGEPTILQVTVSEEIAAVVWQTHSLVLAPAELTSSFLAEPSQVRPAPEGAVWMEAVVLLDATSTRTVSGN